MGLDSAKKSMFIRAYFQTPVLQPLEFVKVFGSSLIKNHIRIIQIG